MELSCSLMPFPLWEPFFWGCGDPLTIKTRLRLPFPPQDLPSTIQFDLVVRDRSQQERFAARPLKVCFIILRCSACSGRWTIRSSSKAPPKGFKRSSRAGVMHLSDRDHDARIELYYRPQDRWRWMAVAKKLRSRTDRL